MKIIFMGTPDFAVPCLEICHEMGEVIMVVTQPDRQKGRGKKLSHTPVKEKALELGLQVFQPERIKREEATAVIEALKPDLIIVVAYGQILSTRLLEIPSLGCINVHASLLPKLRGASPINWSIVSGEKETGVTTMFMSEGLDEGDMIDKLSMPITDKTTAGELHDALMILGGKVLRETLTKCEKGSLQRTPQEGSLATYAPLLKKEMGKIDWSASAESISCLIRGFDPWPTAYTTYEEQVMKLYETSVEDASKEALPGTVLDVGKNGMLVQTGSRGLRVQSIQMPNGKKMRVADYILGHEIKVGLVLK